MLAHRRLGLIAAAACLAIVVASMPASVGQSDEAPIFQPGTKIANLRGGGCVGAFVLTDGHDLYVLTAGHCATRGERVYIAHPKMMGYSFAWGPVLGTVVVSHASLEMRDWAIIRVNPDIADQVSPSVTHWTGPTDVRPVATMNKFNEVCFYGGSSTMTAAGQRPRCGLFAGDMPPDHRSKVGAFSITSVAIPGDSGSPVIDKSTGGALGILVGGGAWIDGGTVFATSLDSMLHAAKEYHGLDLRLVTAPYDPPPLGG